jgi:hypothetical protein
MFRRNFDGKLAVAITILGHILIILLLSALIRLVSLEGRFKIHDFTDTQAINFKISE